MKNNQKFELSVADISPEMEKAARNFGSVAWDIETSGLDWEHDKIGTCQLYVPNFGTEIVRVTDATPSRMVGLLESPEVTKIFHHAPFDLRFMRFHWKANPSQIACTKISAKISTPGLDPKAYSLKPLLEVELGVSIDKTQQRSDWLSQDLSQEQLEYASSDVVHLHNLLDRLLVRARSAGTLGLIQASFDYIPTRVETDLLHVGDVFTH